MPTSQSVWPSRELEVAKRYRFSRMLKRWVWLRMRSRSPTTAGLAMLMPPVEFTPTNPYFLPAAKTYVSPASLNAKTWPRYAHGDTVNPAGLSALMRC